MRERGALLLARDVRALQLPLLLLVVHGLVRLHDLILLAHLGADGLHRALLLLRVQRALVLRLEQLRVELLALVQVVGRLVHQLRHDGVELRLPSGERLVVAQVRQLVRAMLVDLLAKPRVVGGRLVRLLAEHVRALVEQLRLLVDLPRQLAVGVLVDGQLLLDHTLR